MSASASTPPASDAILESVAGLVFLGTESQLDPRDLPSPRRDACAVEAARVARALQAHGRGLDTLLSAELLYDPDAIGAAELLDGLARALPPDCRPCVTPVPVEPGSLGGRAVAVQAVSAARPPAPGDDGRFPQTATAGEVVAVAGQTSTAEEAIAAQTRSVLERIGGLLATHGAGLDDVVRFGIFYVGEGGKRDWEIAAHDRASFFSEPGPAATGIPVRALPDARAMTSIRVLAVRGARTRGLRRHAWPDGHWDWTFHTPYRHGCAVGAATWVGGQVSLTEHAEVLDPGDLPRQTTRSMRNIERVLAELGLGGDRVERLTAFYVHEGPHSRRELLDAIGASLGERDVELTLVPLHVLAYEQMVVEIDAEARA